MFDSLPRPLTVASNGQQLPSPWALAETHAPWLPHFSSWLWSRAAAELPPRWLLSGEGFGEGFGVGLGGSFAGAGSGSGRGGSAAATGAGAGWATGAGAPGAGAPDAGAGARWITTGRGAAAGSDGGGPAATAAATTGTSNVSGSVTAASSVPKGIDRAVSFWGEGGSASARYPAVPGFMSTV